jgi:hypothetical protein
VVDESEEGKGGKTLPVNGTTSNEDLMRLKGINAVRVR